MPPGFLSRKERREKYAKRKSFTKPILARFRTRDLRTAITGTYTLTGVSTTTSSALVGKQEDCTDTVYAFETVNPFDMYTKESYYPVLNGYRLSGSSVIRSFTDFPVGYRPGPVDPRAAFPALLPTEISDFAWSTLAASNPNKPLVEVPAFVGELKDFFSLIRSTGQTLINQCAQGYLAQRWLLDPLWSDLQKMLRFQRDVNQRMEMMHNLQNGKVIKKRVNLRNRSSTSAPTSVTIHSEGAVFGGKTRIESEEKVWGTANWKLAPATRLPRLMRLGHPRWGIKSSSQKWIDKHVQRGYNENKAFSQALSAGFAEYAQNGILSIDSLATAWELCPWSWLIDWCTNYGDIIAASRNAIPVIHSNVAIMRKTWSLRRFYDIGTDSRWARLTMTGNYGELATRKERFRPILLPFSLPCFLPLIEEGHWQILASLALSSGRLPLGRRVYAKLDLVKKTKSAILRPTLVLP
jgi:hypothetical protein